MQLGLFDQSDLAEFSHPDYPGERLIACRNPLLGRRAHEEAQRTVGRHRRGPRPRHRRGGEGRLAGADTIGLKVGKVINKYKMAKHFEVAIGEGTLSVIRRDDAIAAEAALDGIYVLRTTIEESDLDAPGVVEAYKALAHVERDFRHLKIDDIDLRPIHHRLEARVRSHVFICMLASYLVWHLREASLRSPSPTRHRRRGPTRSPRRSARPGPGPRRPPKRTKTAKRSAGSASSSSTWGR